VPSPGRRTGAEVTEVPGEDCGLAGCAHRHDSCVGQVDADGHVLLHEVERMRMLCVRGPIEVVRAFEECTSEHDRRRVMASRAKHQVDFDVHWPGDDHPAAQDGEEPGCELMPPSLGSIAR